MILAAAIAAPIMVVCCGGGLALLGSALAGATGLFYGFGGLPSVFLALVVGGLLLTLPRVRRSLGDRARREHSREGR